MGALEDIVARKKAALEAYDPAKIRAPYDAGIAATEANAAAQREAAIAAAAFRGAGSPAEAAVAEIVNQGSASRLAQMARERELGLNYYGDVGRAEGDFYTGFDQSIPLREWYAGIDRAEAESRGRGGGGRGGGRGGGGGGSGSDLPDAYWVNDWEIGGPRGSLYDAVGSESQGQGMGKRLTKTLAREEFDRRSAPGWARRYAIMEQFGLSPERQKAWFDQGPHAKALLPEVQKGLDAGASRRQVLNYAQKYARKTPGDQGPLVNYIASQLGVKKKRKKKR